MQRRAPQSSGTLGQTPPTLTLLGTLHHDPNGFRITRRALDELLPEVILVELSPFGWAFRKRCGHYFTRLLVHNLQRACSRQGIAFRPAFRHPEIQAIFRQLQLPFEYRAAARFSRKRRVPLHLVDLSSFSARHIRNWPELLATANLSLLLQGPANHPSVPTQYQLATRILAKNTAAGSIFRPHRPLFRTQSSSAVRERYLACQVERALQWHPRSRLLYIGGWQHLQNRPGIASLASLLRSHSPRSLLLNTFYRPPLSHAPRLPAQPGVAQQ